MPSRRTLPLALFCTLSLGAMLMPIQVAAAESQGNAPAADASTPVSYNSDPGFGSLPGDNYNSPESDARPGEYYFKLAVLAVKHKDYAHAVAMYKVAASWAFKPAEYNLGIMYFRGQGVPKDRPRGLAWMVLAAERGDKHYVAARNLMATALSNAEFARADKIFGQLKPTFGDQTALARAKRRWAYVRSHKTGSRVGGTVGELHVGAMASGHSGDSAGGSPQAAMMSQTATTAGGIVGGNSVDGSVAYRQFRLSNNPYDVKFKPLIGEAAAGPLQQVTPAPAKGAAHAAGKHHGTGKTGQGSGGSR